MAHAVREVVKSLNGGKWAAQGRTNFGPAAQTDLTVDMEEVELGAVVSLDRFETTAQAISDAGGDRSST